MNCAQDSPTIRFEAWQSHIERATSVDQLMTTMRQYLGAWTPETLMLLPSDLAATALPDTEAIYARAYIASRLELSLTGNEPAYNPLKEMALALAAAATRLRALQAYRAVANA